MEWTRLVLKFFGQIAWPLAVLALGVGFRKPLMDILRNGTMGLPLLTVRDVVGLSAVVDFAG